MISYRITGAAYSELIILEFMNWENYELINTGLITMHIHKHFM